MRLNLGMVVKHLDADRWEVPEEGSGITGSKPPGRACRGAGGSDARL